MLNMTVVSNSTPSSFVRPNGQKRSCSRFYSHLVPAIVLAFGFVSGMALLPSLQQVALAADQHIYQATYSVDYDGLRLGSSQRDVFVTENRVVVSQHTLRPEGLAVLFGEVEYTDTAQIHIGSEQVSLLSVQRNSDKSSDSYTASFDWKNRSIKIANGNVLEMPDHDVHDFESWLMLLMVTPAQHRDGSLITILERKDRLRTYLIQRLDNAVIDIQGHSYETLRFQLENVDDASRSYTVWVAPELHNAVVQIVKRKKSNELKFTITAFRDLTSGGS